MSSNKEAVKTKVRKGWFWKSFRMNRTEQNKNGWSGGLSLLLTYFCSFFVPRNPQKFSFGLSTSSSLFPLCSLPLCCLTHSMHPSHTSLSFSLPLTSLSFTLPFHSPLLSLTLSSLSQTHFFKGPNNSLNFLFMKKCQCFNCLRFDFVPRLMFRSNETNNDSIRKNVGSDDGWETLYSQIFAT